MYSRQYAGPQAVNYNNYRRHKYPADSGGYMGGYAHMGGYGVMDAYMVRELRVSCQQIDVAPICGAHSHRGVVGTCLSGLVCCAGGQVKSSKPCSCF